MIRLRKEGLSYTCSGLDGFSMLHELCVRVTTHEVMTPTPLFSRCKDARPVPGTPVTSISIHMSTSPAHQKRPHDQIRNHIYRSTRHLLFCIIANNTIVAAPAVPLLSAHARPLGTPALNNSSHIYKHNGNRGLFFPSMSAPLEKSRWVRWPAGAPATTCLSVVCRKGFLRAMIGRLEEDKSKGMAQFSHEEGKVGLGLSRLYSFWLCGAVRYTTRMLYNRCSGCKNPRAYFRSTRSTLLLC